MARNTEITAGQTVREVYEDSIQAQIGKRMFDKMRKSKVLKKEWSKIKQQFNIKHNYSQFINTVEMLWAEGNKKRIQKSAREIGLLADSGNKRVDPNENPFSLYHKILKDKEQLQKDEMKFFYSLSQLVKNPQELRMLQKKFKVHQDQQVLFYEEISQMLQTRMKKAV